jgi:hypothetical protein
MRGRTAEHCNPTVRIGLDWTARQSDRPQGGCDHPAFVSICPTSESEASDPETTATIISTIMNPTISAKAVTMCRWSAFAAIRGRDAIFGRGRVRRPAGCLAVGTIVIPGRTGAPGMNAMVCPVWPQHPHMPIIRTVVGQPAAPRDGIHPVGRATGARHGSRRSRSSPLSPPVHTRPAPALRQRRQQPQPPPPFAQKGERVSQICDPVPGRQGRQKCSA